MRDSKDVLTLIAVVAIVVVAASIMSDSSLTGEASRKTYYPGGSTWSGHFDEPDDPDQERARTESTQPFQSSACSEGSTVCEGDDLYLCRDNEMIFWQRCQEGCDKGSCAVEERQGANRCVSNYVQAWDDDTGWRTVQRCKYGCTNGVCVGSQVCDEGATRCEDGNRVVCENGQWLTRECSYGCAEGACVAEEKTPLDEAIETAKEEEGIEPPQEEQPAPAPGLWERFGSWMRKLVTGQNS